MVYIESKAGRFVGKTGRCAVLVIADKKPHGHSSHTVHKLITLYICNLPLPRLNR